MSSYYIYWFLLFYFLALLGVPKLYDSIFPEIS